MQSKQINFKGIDLELTGNENDHYFKHIERIMAKNAFDGFARRFCPTQGVVLDVGANIGATALMAMRWMRQGHIICFEPGQQTFRNLQTNIDRNTNPGDNKITLENQAIGAEPGTLRFAETVFSAGSHVVTDAHMDPGKTGTVSVPVTTLDTYIAQAGLDKVDIVKVDVEGHEIPLLNGSANLLSQKDAVWFVEFNSWTLIAHGNASPRDFLDAFRETGMNVYLVRGEKYQPIVTAQDFFQLMHFNIVKSGCVNDLVLSRRPLHTYVQREGQDIYVSAPL